MTYEEAVFYRLLLLCGYRDELQEYVDTALRQQDPLSDIVLNLSTIAGKDKAMLSVFNEYLTQVSDSGIDYDNAVFELVVSFLRQRYADDAMPMKSIAGLMHQLALHTERYLEEPWQTMYLLGIVFDEAETGYIDKADYRRKFDAFVSDGVLFSDYPPVEPQ